MDILRNDDLLETIEKIHEEECRICLQKTVEICRVFRDGDAIARKIMAVASVQVKEDDGLPAIICLACNNLLDASYNFKLQIQSSDEKLRQFLKMKKDEESLSSKNIVKAIIADVISSVISSEQTEDMESLAIVEQTFYLKSENTETPLGTNTESLMMDFQEECIADDPSENRSTNDSGLIKEEELKLFEENDLREKSDHPENLFELQQLKMVEARSISEEASRVDGIQDEEEKPLIWRTTRLRCGQCIKSFCSKIALKRHSIVHKRKTKLRYVCYVCEKQYSSVAKLKRHVAICHEIEDRRSSNNSSPRVQENIITLRDNRVVQKQRLRSAQQNLEAKENRRNRKFVCKVCSKQFTYRKSFMSHASSHPEYKLESMKDSCLTENEKTTDILEEEEEVGDEGEYDEEDEDLPSENLQCTQCGKLFATKRNLKRHVSTHSGLKYNCTTCGKGFSRIDKLKDHEQSKHNTEIFGSSEDDKEDSDNVYKDCLETRKKDRQNRPHKCAICPKSFAQAQSLANHIERHKRVKETQKRFLCEVCSKCFAQSGSLVAHMRTHTGVKPYVCNVCSRAFTKSTYLQLHLRTHSGEKPYICQYCSRAFARANTLARHITMHTGEAKYHCQICTKSFRRLTSLNEHTYTHTGQRPYACKICTKRYNNAGSLYAHRKKCKAQQLSSGGFGVSMAMENAAQQQDSAVPQVLIYSQRKLVEDATVGQVTPTPQYMIANVHNQKALASNIIQPFTVDDPNVYAINSKQFKNPYYTIYPNI